MDNFKPALVELRPFLDKRLAQIPQKIHPLIKKNFPLNSWDKCSREQREQVLFWHDLQNDPKTDKSCLHLYQLLKDEADELAGQLRDSALKRWGIVRDVKILDAMDSEQLKREFRVWFWDWWRKHNRTAPIQKEVYEVFGRPRGLGRRPSIKLLDLVRKDMHQKRGQPGISKKGRPRTERPIRSASWAVDYIK